MIAPLIQPGQALSREAKGETQFPYSSRPNQGVGLCRKPLEVLPA